MGAALTAFTGNVLKMLNNSIYGSDPLPTEAELQTIAKHAYNRLLTELCSEQRSTPHAAPDHSATNHALIDYYQRLCDLGGHTSLLPEEECKLAERGWDERRIEDLRMIIELREKQDITRFRPGLADQELRRLGYTPCDMLRWMVELVLYPAYRDAHIDAERALQLSLSSNQVRRDSYVDEQPAKPSNGGAAETDKAPPIPADWRDATATEAANRLIAHRPALFDHRRTGKRQIAAVDEQTLRQIRWAASLLERSMAGRPLWTLRDDDLKTLDQWFDRLPVTTGKAPWHRDPATTLESICLDAQDKIEEGAYEADAIGLHVGTTNKHFRKLSQVYEFMRERTGNVVPALKFSSYILPDIKRERDARAAYTVEQGKELFSLPPWVGCASEKKRLENGGEIYHDSLYFVLLLVWYTGMRREEVCKLLVDDVKKIADIWHIDVKFTSAGRVKTSSSIRLIAICDELRRLGFIEYVQAIRAAGHDALFPEIVSERKNAKKGDTFYKLWWIYIKPLVTSLQRGQALHAARHMVETELKELEVFPEYRDDALGHKSEGEGPSRYAKATRLEKLQEVVNQIPVVTDHLPSLVEIRLLPADMRRPRGMRPKTLEKTGKSGAEC